MTFQLPSIMATSRFIGESIIWLSRNIRHQRASFKRFARKHKLNFLKRKETKSAEVAFIDFIIEAASNSPFAEELKWQLESFQEKSRKQQSKLFPGFYLYIEKYLFNYAETSKHSFREVLYQQFRVAIDQNSALKIIFLDPEKQIHAVYRRFLYSVARKSQRYQKVSGLGSELQLWLDGKNSFVSFSKFSRKEGTDLLIHFAHDFFYAVCTVTSDRVARKIFNDAYDKQALRYQNLDSFHEVLKLFPNQALDETKFNLLSIQEMKMLLADKVKKLETLTVELNEKNSLLEKSYEEVLAQSEQLNAQNHQLEEAQNLIHMMNDELTSYSYNLEEKIQERTKELAHKNDLLTHYNNNLEQYTFAISHQLKAPITRLLGLTNLWKIVPANEQVVIAGSINKSAKDLDETFKDLVHSLNFKKEVADLKKEQVGINALIKATWNNVVKDHGTQPQIDWHLETNAVLETDPIHLTSALSKVFENAIKFRKPGDHPKIKTAIRSAEGKLEINIQDQGIGFDSNEVRSKLFTPFQRFNQTHEGRGMGLYFTKQHLSILGGDVKINSIKNSGTEVTIELPLRSQVV